MPQILMIFFWNSLVLLAGLLGVELLWGNWLGAHSLNTLNLVKEQQWEMEVSKLYGEGAAGTHITYTRDQHGLRGAPEDLAKIDVLTVGGSTTDQRYIDDTHTWQQVMQRELAERGKPVHVANAGVDGQSTLGHLKNFDLWFNNLPNLAPKFIVFYVGINDFYRTKQDQKFDALEQNWKEKIKQKSALYYFWRTVYGTYQATVVNPLAHLKDGIKPEDINWATQGLLTQNPAEYKTLMAGQLEAYAARIQALTVATKAMGATPVFVTQQTRQYRQENGQVYGVSNWPDTYEEHKANGVDKFYMMALLNQKLMDICAQSEAVCLNLAEEAKMDWRTDYYDYVHNTPAGAEKIGRYLAQKMAPLF